MKHSLRQLLVALALVLTIGVEQAAADNVLRIGRNEDSTTLDPIKTSQNVDIWIDNNIHAFLLRSNREGDGVELDLAEDYGVSDDQKVYTFTLKRAKFSDGSPVTAEDAVFSLTRLRDHEESAMRSVFAIMESVEAIDDRQIRITLSEPSAAFLPSLSMAAASIVPKHAIEADEEGYGTSPVTAGIYKVVEWRRGEMLALEPNEHYYGGAISKVDRVEWHVIPDDNTRVLKVRAGELDAAIMIPFSLIPSLEQDAAVSVHLDPSTREDSLLMNHENPVLAKKEVRQAINMALNLDAITQVVTFGKAQVANSLMPAGTMFYYADNKNLPYDPEKAKELIKAAGAEGAELTFNGAAGNKANEQIAVMIQQQLAAIGLKVNIRKLDPGQTWGRLVEGDYDLAVVYWTYDVLDPDQKVAFTVGADENKSYFSRYENPEVTELVKKARAELDEDTRRQMYYDIQAKVKEDVHWVDLFYSPFSNISRKGVEGFYQNPMGIFPLHEISVD